MRRYKRFDPRSLKYFLQNFKPAFDIFLKNDLFDKAAALSYYTIFALPPMLVVVIYTAKTIYSKGEIRDFMFNELSGLFGDGSATSLFAALESSGMFEGALWSNLISIAILIFTSTTVLVTIQSALNQIFSIDEEKEIPWYRFLIDRAFSFSLLLGFAFLLIVSMVVNALIAAFQSYIATAFTDIILVLSNVLNFFIPLTIMSLLLGAIFRWMPDRRIPWFMSLRGGIVTAILLAIGKYGISFYISTAETATLYDAAGDIMVIMVWVFYASVIFLFGASFTRALMNQRDVRDKA